MGTYKVQDNGKAQSGLSAGDKVVTGGGTYEITGVKADGTYESKLVDKNTTTKNYTGSYSSGSQSKRDRDNETISQPGGTLYYSNGTPAVTNTGKAWQNGVDYAAEAAKYAAIGDWGGVNDMLMRRKAKINDNGITGVQSNLEVWKELNDKYNGPSAGVSLSDMQAGAAKAYGSGGQYGSMYGYGNQTSLNQTTTGQPYGTYGYGSFEDFLAGMGYDQYAEQTQAVIKAAVDKAINGYRDQIDTTNNDTAELARQAYINKMLGQKNLDQQLSANGYAGGMADSQRIATETSYQNQLNELEKQRQATVKELESAITNAQLTGDMQTAQELSSYLQQIQGQWVNYVQNQQQMAQQDYWNQKQMDNSNYWNQQNLDAQNTESIRSWALQQISMGIMPEDETLTAAGINKQAAQQQVAMVPSQSQQKTGGGYNNGSLTSSQVQELQRALGVTADGLWGSESKAAAAGMTADQAWEAYQGQNAGTTRFGFLTYKTLIQNKQYDAADEYLAKYWDTMSDTDRARVNLIIKDYGPQQNNDNSFMKYLEGTGNADTGKGNLFIDKYGIQ